MVLCESCPLLTESRQLVHLHTPKPKLQSVIFPWSQAFGESVCSVLRLSLGVISLPPATTVETQWQQVQRALGANAAFEVWSSNNLVFILLWGSAHFLVFLIFFNQLAF